MTGPEHYKAAEEILAAAKDSRPDADVDNVLVFLRFAEVHAALALAAATALNDHSHGGGEGGMPVADFNSWHKVAGVETP
jgi:hypothetical protein